MKKTLKLVVLLFVIVILSSCGRGNEIDLSDVGSLKMGDITITPEKAEISDDNTLILNMEWIRGHDEDSMNKESFVSSGILLFATQGDEWLEDEIDSETNLYKDVYEASESTIYPRFKLKNTDDDVIITFKKMNIANETFTIKLK